jgi:hypothetical protein
MRNSAEATMTVLRTLRFVSALIGATMLSMPVTASAQIRASELGSMSQVIDGTKLSVTYSRPRARGRDPLFGTRVAHWGETWTPGANWATLLEVDKEVSINGTVVPKGKYSVWMVLREHEPWTTVLDPDWHRFHMEPPDSNAKQIRISTTVEQAPFAEVLTWSMPEVNVSGGTLAMQWGSTRATLKVMVRPTLSVAIAEADAAPYLGRYTYTEKAPNGTNKAISTFIVTYDANTLKARWEPNDDYMQTFALIRVGPDIFTAGLYDKSGAIYEVLRPDMMFTFKRVNGRPATFDVRNESDVLEATGTRKP